MGVYGAYIEYAMADQSLTDPMDGFRKARADAERAVALDPTVASGYLTLATIQMSYHWNWDAADASLTDWDTCCIRSVDTTKRAPNDQRAIVRDPLRPGSYKAKLMA